MLNSQQKLQYLYLQKLLPLERFSNFDKFYNLPIPDSEFVAKPHVLLLGQYSTGKTTVGSKFSSWLTRLIVN